MSDTYGALYIQGQQINLPGGGGNQGIGQYAIPASGIQYTVTLLVPDSSGSSIPLSLLPIPPTGVLIIPPVAGTVPFTFRTVFGDTGIDLSPAYPSWVAFNPADHPAYVYFVAATGHTVDLTVQFI